MLFSVCFDVFYIAKCMTQYLYYRLPFSQEMICHTEAVVSSVIHNPSPLHPRSREREARANAPEKYKVHISLNLSKKVENTEDNIQRSTCIFHTHTLSTKDHTLSFNAFIHSPRHSPPIPFPTLLETCWPVLGRRTVAAPLLPSHQPLAAPVASALQCAWPYALLPRP